LTLGYAFVITVNKSVFEKFILFDGMDEFLFREEEIVYAVSFGGTRRTSGGGDDEVDVRTGGAEV